MEISEVIRLRKELEQSIMDQLTAFEKQTGIDVSSAGMTKIFNEDKDSNDMSYFTISLKSPFE